MPASNTKDCFKAFIGQKVIGCLFDALPSSDEKIAAGTKALVFEDGRALVISPSGTFWVANRDEVAQAIKFKRRQLERSIAEQEAVLELAGALTS